ncbi:MAG TPA: hypothetical protein VMJ10_01910 [Kofleriaceae bacterium]|nr:hypothetical protein [Kofleriaceae bacterium]
MHPLKQRPVFGHDVEMRKQLRETRDTLLAHLRDKPDDFNALVLADVIGELDADPSLSAHRAHFRAIRPDDWREQARVHGLDRVLYHLAEGLRSSGFGKDAIPVFERRADEIAEARAPGVAPGSIDASFVPDALTTSRRARVVYAGTELASVRVTVNADVYGSLSLDTARCTGEFELVEPRGGSGTAIYETYADGAVHTTLCTPWHDGTESTEPKIWTRWVMDCIADLARISRT